MSLFNDTSALYFYSSVFQANAALLPVVAFLGVSKLQSIGGKIENIRSVLLEDRGQIINQPTVLQVDQMTTEEKREWVKPLSGSIKAFGSSWISLEEECLRTKQLLKKPTILLGRIMALSVFGVASASWVHNASPVCELIFIGITLFYNFYIIYIVVERVIQLCS